MNEFPQRVLTELRHDSAHLGVFGQAFNPRQDFKEEARTSLGNALFQVPVLNVPEVLQRGFRNPDAASGHWLNQAKASSGFGQAHVATGLQVIDALHDGAHEFAFFLGVLVFREGLNDRNATSPAGQQQGAACFHRVPYHAAGVFFQVAEGHNIRGETNCHLTTNQC